MTNTKADVYPVGNLGFMQVDDPGNACPECGRDIVIPWDDACLKNDHPSVKEWGAEIGVPLPPEDAPLSTYCECWMLLIVRIAISSIQYVSKEAWNGNPSPHQPV